MDLYQDVNSPCRRDFFTLTKGRVAENIILDSDTFFIGEKSRSKYIQGKMLAEENSKFILTHFCDLVIFPIRPSKTMPSFLASDPYLT